MYAQRLRIVSFAAMAVCTLSLTLAFSGCGGGGSGTMPRNGGSDGGDQAFQPVDGPAAITLTGAQPPAETVDDVAERELRILNETDFMLLSNIYAETNDSAHPNFVVESVCSYSSCTVTVPESEQSFVFSPDDFLRGLTIDGSAILTKNGITMLRDFEDDYHAYGAWMEHAAFGVQTGSSIPGTNATFYALGAALGDRTGTKPTAATATWQGLMVGTPPTGPAKGNTLQGDATLTFDMTTSSIDVAFTDIKDIKKGDTHSSASVLFDDVPVSSAGTYETGTAGNLISGAFYGSSHAETAGVFEHSGIVGAFGAKKQ